MQADELKIELPYLQLSARSWGYHGERKLLALHGWLDNAASFDLLAPKLVELIPDLHIVALDLPGHGHSQHPPRYGGFHFLNYITVVLETLDFLGWREAILMGHSMGGGVASLLAGALPERVKDLILIEALGGLSGQPEEAPSRYRQFWKERFALFQRSADRQIDLQQAVRARSIAGQIGEQNAKLLVERNLVATAEGYSWRSDVRLRLPTPVLLMEEQVRAFLSNIAASTLLILARDTSFSAYREMILKRTSFVKNITVKEQLEGGHHLHMIYPHKVALLIADWLE